jgi:hypothetical protein
MLFKDELVSGYSGYSGVPGRADLIGRGTSQDIVNVLSVYGRSLPIAFLANVLKRSTTDLQRDLEPLEQRQVLRVEGDTVSLL